jgi:hypothetical protein
MSNTELYILDDVRGTLWWKTRIWKLRGVRGNTVQGIYPVHNKEEEWSHILDNRLTNNAETGIRGILRYRNAQHWKKCDYM